MRCDAWIMESLHLLMTGVGSRRLIVTKVRPLEEMSLLKLSQVVKRMICVYVRVLRI